MEDRCVPTLFQPIGAFPAIGADTQPSIIYTIGAGTITATNTGQPAYERVEDAYIGVRNLAGSGVTLTGLNLAGPSGFTDFDGDGIAPSPNPTSGLPGLGVFYGPTGYEGPGTSYTGYTPFGTSLTVNFNDPSLGGGLPPGYQTFFSLELPPSSLNLLIAVPPPNQTAVEGTSQSFNLGAFTASGTGPWTVVVNWGDNTSTTFSQSSAGTITPQGHTYAEEGSYTATVTVAAGGQSSSESFGVTVSDPAVVATGVPAFSLTEGAASLTNAVLATFTDPGDPHGTVENAADYAATVNWGDGQSSSTSGVSGSSLITVQVGYADDLRPSPFFPSPWNGSPNTVFVGNTSNIDAGAIRIINNSSSPITVNDVKVTLPGGHTFYLWGSNVVPAGGNLILTQTAAYNFDTSDFPTLAFPNTYPDGETDHAAHIDVTVNGAAQPTFLDTGHVLTTGGSDLALGGANESLNWRPVGTTGVGNPGGSNVTIINNGNGSYSVIGSHLYAGDTINGESEGTANITVTISHENSAPQTVTDQAIINDPPVVATGGPAVSAVEGASTGPVLLATFTDPGGPEEASDYSADLNWGDGTGTQVGAGTIVLSGSTFQVYGSHTYTEEGAADHPNSQPYQITVTIHHDLTTQTASTTATVSDPAVVATSVSVSATAGAPFSGAVATFTDPGGAEPLSDYSAIVNWGDGTPLSAGTITFSGGVFTVSGKHTYAAAGSYTITCILNHETAITTVLSGGATVTDLGIPVQPGLTATIGFWQGPQGQKLINRFGLTSTGLTLGQWLATTFPKLYGGVNGAPNLSTFTDAQVAAFYVSLFNTHGQKLNAQVLDTALDVFATTSSLGGTTAQAFGFMVNAYGLGAYSWNVGSSGAAFGVPNNTTLNVYQILLAANNSAVGGRPWDSDTSLRDLANAVFDGLNRAGDIG